jgi:hypothetical protein
VITALLTFLGGVAVGYLHDRWREARLMRRLAPLAQNAPMSTTPPTVTELHGTVTVSEWEAVE